MDAKTLLTYDLHAESYAEGWLTQPKPTEIYKAVEQHFKKDGLTADIGSGSGRDVFWLNENGYPCTGFEASSGLLAEAKSRFPSCHFVQSVLPELKEIQDQSFENVLCETVIMHLDSKEHLLCLKNLLRILKPGGVLHLSWRHPDDENQLYTRDEKGRLYAKVDAESLIAFAVSLGASVLEHRSFISPSSGKPLSELALKVPRTL